MTTTATAHLLKTTPDGIELLGSQCNHCGEVYFPKTNSCTACCREDTREYSLGNSGVLWSWTVQSFLPKAPYNSGETPENFTPYGVGYIQMSSGVKVESRLTVADPKVLKIGMPMRLIVIQYGTGQLLSTYAFAPCSENL